MILEEVILENVQCYYGKKTFRFTNGLNIVLSENGEGKTKFIEAFEWLFNGEESKLESLVSAKKLHETNIGERFSVSVSITVNQHDEIKTLKRFFIVEKLTDSVRVSKSEMNGDIVNLNGERTEVNGNHLLESVFPSTIVTSLSIASVLPLLSTKKPTRLLSPSFSNVFISYSILISSFKIS